MCTIGQYEHIAPLVQQLVSPQLEAQLLLLPAAKGKGAAAANAKPATAQLVDVVIDNASAPAAAPAAAASSSSSSAKKNKKKSRKDKSAGSTAPTATAAAAAGTVTVKPRYETLVADSDADRRALREKVFKVYSPASSGGLRVHDEELLRKQRTAVWELVKVVGNKIAEGMELRDITMPLSMLAPVSMLEQMTKAWAYAPTFLAKAARCTDPVERFKNVMCFALAGMHLAVSANKPINPVLGETFQAYYNDGTQVFLEQTTHHPPAANWQVIGPAAEYHYWGRGVGSASARGNMIRGYQHGPNCIDFADGTRIVWSCPVLVVHGIAWGERVQHFEGTLEFRDETNNIRCDLVMNAEALGFVKSLFSKPKQKTDYLRGDIMIGGPSGKDGAAAATTATTGAAKKVCTLEGSWLTHLEFDGTRYWDAETSLPHVLHPVPSEQQLASDALAREDLLAVADGDMERAAECKQMLEDRQRYDRRLREKAHKL